VQTSQIDDTRKFLWELSDNLTIESVLIFSNNRTTLCISCQVGCNIGCDFCATGKLGLKRNLTVEEILEQVRFACLDIKKLKKSGLTNIVFMGMGEPTQNLDNVLKSVDYITKTAPFGFGVSAKNITISTVGVPAGIEEMAKDPHDFRLAVSLHMATDELRSQIIPVNKVHNIAAVLDAAYSYFKAKNSRITFEWAMIRGANDTEKQAFTLAKRLNQKGSGWAHVNLILLNEIANSPYKPSTPETLEQFATIVKNKGIPVTIRHSAGQDIDGACGQLASVDAVSR
jgi:23S rRNA (adenine2503-C2)-methyltransferase